MTSVKVIVRNIKGGPGSGNWGHSGRQGLVGGSTPGSGSPKIHIQPGQTYLLTDAPGFGTIVLKNGYARPRISYNTNASYSLDVDGAGAIRVTYNADGSRNYKVMTSFLRQQSGAGRRGTTLEFSDYDKFKKEAAKRWLITPAEMDAITAYVEDNILNQ